MNIPTQAHDKVKQVGIIGAIKSAGVSLKYTSSLSKIVTHSKTITEISNKTDFNINNRLTIGISGSTRGATHPRLARSKFSTTAGSTVSHTGEASGNIGPGSVVHVDGHFSIGDSYINSHGRIICGDEIRIGDNVIIAWNFEALDDDRHQIVIDGKKPERTSPIEVQDRVWIGHDVSVHKGVTIHEDSVVASNSVVVSDVPSNTLVAGAPAKVIEENVSWEQ